MRIPRIYQSCKLSVGTTLTLTADAANHLIRVLRLNVDDELHVFNGEGGEFSATIISINKQQVIIHVGHYLNIDNESPVTIHLGQAISRGEKMDFVIQKAVELGVAQITPIISERCGVKLSEERWHKRLQHWKAVAISACEQCGRNRLPIINEPKLLNDWTKELQGECKLILNPAGKQSIKNIFLKKASHTIILLIGPEGGFSEVEINLAKQNDFHEISLGPRVLRTETAGIAAIATIQSLHGDF